MAEITFALAKGRLGNKIVKLLTDLKITDVNIDEDTRKLVINSSDGKYSFFLSKPSDVPTFVDYGIADIGVVGKDTILEENRDITELLDLGFGKCRMCVAGPITSKSILSSGRTIRVATKYPNIAKKYFEKTNRSVEIIKLNGSVELGPVVGLSDVIVDIVESGKTLEENGLLVLEEIENLSARLIVNNASLKVKYEEINVIVEGLRGLLEGKAEL
ncbi:MAG: ATP phosphoribosyltransferase [Anaeroplasmataceae bacterium]